MVDDIAITVQRAFGAALKASGFGRIHVNTTNRNIHFPCPLGTFSNSSTKGEQGCTQCTPGKICVLLVHQRISPMIVKYVLDGIEPKGVKGKLFLMIPHRFHFLTIELANFLN